MTIDGRLASARRPTRRDLTPKKEGFTFKPIVNDQPLKLWLRVKPEAQPEMQMDADDFEALFEEYSFEVDRYDGVKGGQDEDEDEDA